MAVWVGEWDRFATDICDVCFATKGPGARATLGHMSVWFGEHQIVVRGSNSEYKLPIYSRS